MNDLVGRLINRLNPREGLITVSVPAMRLALLSALKGGDGSANASLRPTPKSADTGAEPSGAAGDAHTCDCIDRLWCLQRSLCKRVVDAGTSGAEPAGAYTPGPLRAEPEAAYNPDGLWMVVEQSDTFLSGATCCTASYCIRADAQLYAAAPDLLAALTLIVENADDISEYTTLGGDHVVRAVHLKRARAAIGRALGPSAQDTSDVSVEGPGTPSTSTPSAHVGKPTATESGEGSGPLNADERHELECLRHQVGQLEYPCSPHCEGYLRELAMRNGASRP